MKRVPYCLFLARQPPVGLGLPIHEVSRSHTTTRQSVGFLWTSDQLIAETSTWQHTTLKTISARERPQTYDLDRATTGTGCSINGTNKY